MLLGASASTTRLGLTCFLQETGQKLLLSDGAISFQKYFLSLSSGVRKNVGPENLSLMTCF